MSPASALLDKQFRILAGECVALNNLYKLKVGWVKAPRYIKYAVYSNCPPVPAETPLTTGKIHIEPKALCACYDTSAGLGHIGGGQADKGKEAKGIPFYLLFPAVAAVAVLAWLGVRSALHMGLDRGIKKMSVGAAVGVPPVEVGSPGVAERRPAPVEGVPRMMPNHKDKVWITGWVLYPTPQVMLSDGQTHRVPVRVNGGIAHATIDGVEYDSIGVPKRGFWDQ